MIEAEIRKRAIEILEGEGYVTWFPYTNRFAAEKDIFGFADIIAGRGSKLKLIQITEYSHTSHRVKKVKETMEEAADTERR